MSAAAEPTAPPEATRPIAIAGPDGIARDYWPVRVDVPDYACRATYLLVSDQHEVYRVSERCDKLTCTCPHFVHRGHADTHRLGPCKHIRALVWRGWISAKARA